jgi:hypothetical protein
MVETNSSFAGAMLLNSLSEAKGLDFANLRQVGHGRRKQEGLVGVEQHGRPHSPLGVGSTPK